MLKKRLMARLDVKSPNLIGRVRFEGLRSFGDPRSFAENHAAADIDEIIYVDTVASLYGRNNLAGILAHTAENVYCPITVAGGIRSVADANVLLRAGADRIAVNTAATERPSLITDLAMKFGSQCVVLQIDAKRVGPGWEAWRDGGRERTGIDAVEWACRGVELGAGEIFLTSIDQQGTMRGLDLGLIRSVNVSVPVVASGGVRSGADVVAGFDAGASGVAVSSALHDGLLSVAGMRHACMRSGVPVRLVA